MQSNILVVTENKALADILSSTLQKNFNLVVSSHLFDAMAKLKSTSRIKMIILDLVRDNRDYHEFIEYILNSFLRKKEIIVLSTQSNDLTRRYASHSQQLHVVQKPFNPEKILQIATQATTVTNHSLHS
jgi:DNA-binding NtrC family response regulator